MFQLNFFVLSDEVDEIEVYGSEAQSGTQLATYSFEVKKTPKKAHPIGLFAFYVFAEGDRRILTVL